MSGWSYHIVWYKLISTDTNSIASEAPYAKHPDGFNILSYHVVSADIDWHKLDNI